MLLNDAQISQFNQLLKQGYTFCVALSGGIDSVVLLDCLAHFKKQQPALKLRAIHINHGLSPNADDWQKFCLTLCQSLGVELVTCRVEVTVKNRQSLEQVARNIRYQTIGQQLADNECLVTAQHQNDQAETFLLRLKRGSGPAGLAAMQPLSRNPYGSLLWRPLLAVSREQVETYAHQRGLVWVNDESNQDDQFDRNFLRNQVLPTIQARWPSFTQCVSRSASLCALETQLATDLAELDASRCVREEHVVLSALAELAQHRQFNLLRYWLSQRTAQMPSYAQLQQVQAILDARADANPKVCLADGDIRRYQDRLYFLTQQQLNFFATPKTGLGDLQNIRLSDGRAVYLQYVSQGAEIVLPDSYKGLSIRYQLPSSTVCKPAGRQRSRALKKLFQEYQIPVWQRPHIPYLFFGEQLVAALGHWVCSDFAPLQASAGYKLTFSLP